MCGIIACVGSFDAKSVILQGLFALEYRGYDSAGMAWTPNGKLRIDKALGRVSQLAEKVAGIEGRAGAGMGHTRWATHGAASERNCHPHTYGQVTLVHNGIIENYREIAGILESEEIYPQTETDTEVAAMLIGSRYKGNPLKTLTETLPLLEGSYAFCLMFADHPETLYAARKGSPLVVAQAPQGCLASSDILGMIAYTKDYAALPEKSIACLEKDRITLYNYAGREQNLTWEQVNWDIEGAKKQGYEFYMQKEIHEEPEALRRTLLPRIEQEAIRFASDDIPDWILADTDKIVISACGTAMHAGLVGRSLLEKIARIPTQVEIASEFRYQDPILTPKTLVILISQSGETADTLAAMRLANDVGARTLAIVNVKGSTLARESQMVLYTHAGPEMAVASTKAYSVQLAALYLLAFHIALVKGKISPDQEKEYVRKLLAVPDRLHEVLAYEKRVKADCRTLQDHSNLFFIGRGLDYALSMEGSIKLKEISYIHSEAYAAGELKHGTISLITDQVPCIALATQPDLYGKMISNIREVKSRGANVVLITRQDFQADPSLYDVRFDIPDADPLLSPFFSACYLQMIAYYVSYAKGLDVDHPRNLAKSVTVE